MNTARLAGLHVLVTGAGRGLGAAIGARLAQDGASLSLHYHRSSAGAEALAQRIRDDGGRAQAVAADLRVTDECRRLVAQCEDAFGACDGLVLNAGISRGSPLLAADFEALEDTLRSNLQAPMQLTALVLPGMLRRRFGRVVALGSPAAQGGLNGQCAYAASKAGLAGFIKTLANEMSPRMDFTANLVLPGVIPTELTERAMTGFTDALRSHIPAGRFGTPEDAAAAVAYLLSPDAAYVNGHELVVDGGWSLRYLPRRAARPE